MKLSDDAYLQGPLTPVEPRDPYERSVLNHAEYGEDFVRERYFRNLMVGTPRPLTIVERWAAAEDPRACRRASTHRPRERV